MIIVVASELDSDAERLAATWPRREAVLLTPRDLCTRGWTIELGRFNDGSFVAGGTKHSIREIDGAITLFSCVYEHELFGIEKSDRRYVCAELVAHLVYFLSNLPCPILGKPTPECLNGPAWRQEQWALACRASGIRTELATQAASPVASNHKMECVRTLSFIGAECVDLEDIELNERVCQVASLAGANLFQLKLRRSESGPIFHSVQLAPDLTNTHVVTAIQNYLTPKSN